MDTLLTVKLIKILNQANFKIDQKVKKKKSLRKKQTFCSHQKKSENFKLKFLVFTSVYNIFCKKMFHNFGIT